VTKIELTTIQAALQAAQLDGWLFYDHHQRDPIAYRVLKLKPGMYAHAVIRIPVGRVTEIERSDDGSPLPPLSGGDVADTGPLAKAYFEAHRGVRR
jgi:hypothetical protein